MRPVLLSDTVHTDSFTAYNNSKNNQAIGTSTIFSCTYVLNKNNGCECTFDWPSLC